MTDIGTIIKEMRLENNKTQKSIYNNFCSRKEISRIENNKCYPTLYTLLHICDVLDISLSYFVFLADNNNNKILKNIFEKLEENFINLNFEDNSIDIFNFFNDENSMLFSEKTIGTYMFYQIINNYMNDYDEIEFFSSLMDLNNGGKFYGSKNKMRVYFLNECMGLLNNRNTSDKHKIKNRLNDFYYKKYLNSYLIFKLFLEEKWIDIIDICNKQIFHMRRHKNEIYYLSVYYFFISICYEKLCNNKLYLRYYDKLQSITKLQYQNNLLRIYEVLNSKIKHDEISKKDLIVIAIILIL